MIRHIYSLKFWWRKNQELKWQQNNLAFKNVKLNSRKHLWFYSKLNIWYCYLKQITCITCKVSKCAVPCKDVNCRQYHALHSSHLFLNKFNYSELWGLHQDENARNACVLIQIVIACSCNSNLDSTLQFAQLLYILCCIV